MTWKSWIRSSAAAGLIMISSACAAHWVVASQPAPGPSGYAMGDPPPAPVEVIPPRPGVDYVWITGRWVWAAPAQEYEWAPGHWQYTGDEHARGDHYDHRGDHDHDVEDVHVYGRPPRDRDERIPPSPGRDYEWVRGRWVWYQTAREYEWEPGRWARHDGNGRGADEHHGDNNGRGNNGNDHADNGNDHGNNGRGNNGNDHANNGNDHGNNGRGNSGNDHAGNGNDHGNNGNQPDSNGRTAHPRPAEPTAPTGHAVDTHPMIRPVPPETRPVPPETRPVEPPTRMAKPIIETGDPQPIAKHPGGGRGTVVVYANREPPHDRIEKPAPQHDPGTVWVGGRWVWQNNNYVWTPGRWMRPQAGFRTWVPGHWAHEAQGWYYVEGYWR
ncbi:MAG TPA: hypothetical protein VF737_13200 [Gemmatimonadaceae bacterium]